MRKRTDLEDTTLLLDLVCLGYDQRAASVGEQKFLSEPNCFSVSRHLWVSFSVV